MTGIYRPVTKIIMEVLMANRLKGFFSLRAPKGANKGFTLLEYCAGAAVLITLVYGAVSTMGTNIGGFLTNIGAWATKQAAEVAKH